MNHAIKSHTLAELLMLGALAMPLTAGAATLLTDNFESYTLNAALPAAGNWPTSQAGASTSRNIINTGTPFGSTTKYLRIADASGTNSVRVQSGNLAAGNKVTTTTVDFYEPNTGGTSSIKIGFSMSGQDLNSAGARLLVNLDDGVVSGVTGGANTYNLDTPYTMTIILNDSAAPAFALGRTVAATTASVWLAPMGTTNYTFAGSAALANSQDASYNFGFRTYSTDLQEMYFDKVLVEEGVTVVPEPRAALLGLVGTCLLLRRRRP